MPELPQAPGLYARTLTLDPDTALRCSIAIPRQYRPADPVPLLLALHYGWEMLGPPPPFYGEGLLLGLVEPALGELEAIIAAPDCPGRDWAEAGSEAALLALLEYLQREYPIDADRILITGYSLGGMGTWHMVSRHPERFCAAIVMAGWPPEDALERIADTPFYIIHSRDDELIPFGLTETAVRELQSRGVAVEFVAAEGITHFETMPLAKHLRAAIPWIRRVWGEGQGIP